MKQVFYTVSIFAVLVLVFIFNSERNVVFYEHDFRFVKQLDDSCRLYAFKTFDGLKDKRHYYTTCKGAVIEPDEINVTDTE